MSIAPMRQEAFLQSKPGTPVDRFGVWLSGLQIRRFVRSFAGQRIGDFGCGYQAAFTRTLLGQVERAVLVDVALADDLKAHPRVEAIEGVLPDALASLPPGSLDVVMIVSVLEHVTEPQRLLSEARRLLAPGGVALINVPSWRGKKYLELSAFRLHLSPAAEMDDHKMYYDVRDLWPLLVAAGFRPSGIRCFTHKFGLNTFAACRADS
ncbi:MAG TPA: class I SAM-dependent methyltransferase [Polyangia bacterium]|nr:class I SAM-dependent methyltransferase [Polyangia bacterium]